MRKKMLSVLMCTAMAAAMLVGCGGTGDTTQAAGTEAAGSGAAAGQAGGGEKEVVTIKLAHNKDHVTIPETVMEAGKRLNERYAAEGRNIEIRFETDYQQIDWKDYHNNIVFAHKSGDAPDIFTCDSDIAGYADAGVAMDVTDLKTDEFVDGAFNACMVDGKAYAIPMDMPFRVIYYNKEALKKIGWTDEEVEALPQQIRNKEVLFEDFTEICREVVEKGGAKYGMVHRPNASNDFYDIVNALGGSYYNEQNQLVFDSQGIMKFFQYIYDNAQVRKITPDNLNQLGWDTINKMVGTGEAFAYYGPMFSATYVAQAAGLTTEEFAAQEAFVLFPAADAASQPFAVAAPQTIAISADTEYPEICKDIVREMVSGSADMMARHASTIYTLSSVKKANEDQQITNHPLLADVTYMTDYAITPPAIEGLNTLNGYLFTEIVTLELGQTTPQESFDNAKAQAELNIDGLVQK